MTDQSNPLDLTSFNVIEFLGLSHLSSQDQETHKPQLEEKVKEYLLVRILDQLPPDFDDTKLKELTSPNDLINLLKQNFPDLKERIISILEDFRKEYENAGR